MSSRFDASVYQKRFWDEWKRSPNSTVCNVPSVFELEGELDVEALRRALNDYVRCFHEVGRTYFIEEGGQLYQVLPDDLELPLEYGDISGDPGRTAESVRAFLRRFSSHVFDLTKPPLIRVGLLRYEPTRYTLIICLHHAISDGISYLDYCQRLSELYNLHRAGRAGDVRPVSPGFRDYVAWEAHSYPEAEHEADLRYWEALLDGVPLAVELPTRAGTNLDDATGRFLYFELDARTSEALRQAARNAGSTLFRVMSVLWAVLLGRYSGQDRLVVSHTVNLRPKQFRHLIGCFMNNIPMVFSFKEGTTFLDLVRGLDEQRGQSKKHQRCSLSDIVQRVRRGKPAAHQAILNVGLNESPGWLRRVPLSLDGMEVRGVPPPECESLYDISLAYENREAIEVRLDYKAALFDGELVDGLVRHFRLLVERFLEAPERPVHGFSLLSDTEREALLLDFNRTQAAFPADRTVDQLFEEQAARTPDRVAATFEGTSLTYAQLEARAEAVAWLLRERYQALTGQPLEGNPLIGLCAERGLDMLAGLLGILKVGGAYVPLDPEHPRERLAYILEDSGAKLVLTQPALLARHPGLATEGRAAVLLDEAPAVPPSSRAPRAPRPPETLAYVMYTSGSTGRPKGVEVLQRGVVNFLESMARRPGFTQEDAVLALTTICFDISVLELFLPLVTGGRVEVVPTAVTRNGTLLRECIERSTANVIQATPATWQMLLAAEWRSNRPLKLLCGGEALGRELADSLRQQGELWNMFGPTETTVWSSAGRVEPERRIHLGRPIANTQLYVHDRFGQPQPPGLPGELYIGGEGVAAGYHARPELTAEKFVRDPYAGAHGRPARMFKTGDLVRFNFDGTLEYLGRIDALVKIRGYRIELGEIETELLKLPEVREAVVVAREDAGGPKRLVAFVVPRPRAQGSGQPAYAAALRRFLPEYMVPSAFVPLRALPKTANEKVDRKTLSTAPMVELSARFGEQEAAPRPVETPRLETPTGARRARVCALVREELRRLCATVLPEGLLELRDTTHLGEYGFDSVRFTALSTAINRRYGLRTNPSIFYSYSTPGSLAEHLVDGYPEVSASHASTGSAAASVPASARRGTGGAALEQVPAHGREAEPIAIIGLAGRLPGSPTLEDFWRNLMAGRDMVSEIPPERWDWREYDGDPATGNKSNVRWGGFLDDVQSFDAAFFGISPREAETMDPQQRLLLETAWQAIEDAGYRASALAGSRTGVFVGCVSTDYWELQRSLGLDLDGFSMSGYAHAILANRISYLFNLRGPSSTIDTACSSSLVALFRAVSAIRAGHCDLALAGGVNVILSPSIHVALSKSGMLSRDGRCKTFDRSANGYVRGEGVGLVLLKPLSRALADGDHIHAVIRGALENHGGRANNLATPNAKAQEELLVRVYEEAGVEPASISYLEAHGTGTSLGDPVEVNALKQAFEVLRQRRGEPPLRSASCGLGSVKSNIGHLESAAGIAAVLKVLLALRHRKLPGVLHFHELNPYIELEGSPFYVVSSTREWEAPRDEKGRALPRRAGISSFGFGGSNAHVILEEAPGEPLAESASRPAWLVTLSAKTDEALAQQLANLEAWLAEHGERQGLEDISYTLTVGREHFPRRCAFVVRSLAELRDSLRRVREGQEPDTCVRGGADGARPPGKREHLFQRFLRSLLAELEAPEALGADEYVERLLAVAELYVQGHALDLEPLHGGERRRRVPLPTYAFQRKRYWVSKAPARASGPASSPHPLLDRVDLAASLAQERGVVFEKRLRPSHPLLRDHQVAGRGVFPGVGYLEMALAAVRQLQQGQGFRLRDVAWLQPAVAEGEEARLRLVLQSEAEGFRYELRTGEGHAATLHGSGVVLPLAEAALAAEEQLAVAEVRARCPQQLPAQAIYERFSATGIRYGAWFQGLHRLWTNGQEALGELVLPEAVAAEAGDYVLHPTLMDAALQTMLGLTLDATAPLLPFSVRELEVRGALGGRMFAYVRAAGPLRFHIALLDEAGRVRVKLHDVALRPLKAAARDFYYVPRWVPEPARPAPPSAPRRTALLVYPPEQAPVAEALRRLLPETDVVELRSLDAVALDGRVVQARHVDSVYFLGLEHEPLATGDMQALARSQERGVLALFRLVRALARYRAAREDLQLKVLVNGVHTLHEGEPTHPNAGALVGLTQALAREGSRWAVSCIDVSLDELRDEPRARRVLEAVVAEPGTAPGNLVLLREGQRYVRRIEKLQLPRTPGTAFRERGVYLLVGGAGGIGLALSHHLASRYKARLVLVGRSAPTAEQQRALAALEAAGGEVLHVQADATDLEAMRRVVAQARARFGRIHGAFHSALVLKDRTLANMDEETLLSVLAPKVQGCVALHAALAGEPLDFLAFFSSAQALLVNPGQGNYAAACTFKDAFARHLGRVSSFPVKIINWGFWGQVGIVATEAYNRRLAAQGVRPIDVQEGLEAIEHILCGRSSQVMPIKLEPSALDALGIDAQTQVNVYPERMPSLLEALGEVGGWLEETHPVRMVEVRA